MCVGGRGGGVVRVTEGKEGRCGRGEVVDGDGEKRRPVTNCVSSGNTKALKETGRDKVGFSFLV